ncbi:MAG: 4a-hydroxytetrahydrobiopterin dehydratase [Nanoarchaeota archaeon]
METQKLSKMKCRACEGLEEKLSKEDIAKYLSFTKRWQVINNHHIEKTFRFKDFSSALEFVNKVGKIAESEQHHPNINFTYGQAKVTLYTHSIDGLSINDFILASKIDEIK